MWHQILDNLTQWAPTLVAIAVSLPIIRIADHLMRRRRDAKPNSPIGILGPLTTLSLIGIALISTILTLPIGDAARGQLLSLLGLLVTGAIALSSTTFLGNGLAGIMLRAIRSFRAGDYIRVGEHVGRVSDSGVLHTEIQTEDRDLTTLPNVYLVTHPVTVLRASGTVVSAEVSLGYDVSRELVELQLIKAASLTGLSEPFVQILDLGDYSILYRIAGFLADTKQIMTTRSNLRKAMLDSLHSAEIEIVSPAFHNQRRLTNEDSFLPTSKRRWQRHVEPSPEARIFDKADAAEAKQKIKDEIGAQSKRIEELEAKLKNSEFEAEKSHIELELAAAKKRLLALQTTTAGDS